MSTREDLQKVLDGCTKSLNWLNKHSTSLLSHVLIFDAHKLVDQLQGLLNAAGYPEHLSAAAAQYRALASGLQNMADNTVTRQNLTAEGRPDVWSDYQNTTDPGSQGANDSYSNQFALLKGYFEDAQSWATALATALDQEADKIDSYLDQLLTTGISLCGLLAGLVVAIFTGVAGAIVAAVSALAGLVAFLLALSFSPAQIESSCGEPWPQPGFAA